MNEDYDYFGAAKLRFYDPPKPRTERTVAFWTDETSPLGVPGRRYCKQCGTYAGQSNDRDAIAAAVASLSESTLPSGEYFVSVTVKDAPTATALYKITIAAPREREVRYA